MARASNNFLQSTTDPLGRVISYAYDGSGNLTAATFSPPSGSTVSVSATYEPTLSQLSSITDPMNRTVNFQHDSSGNLVVIAAPSTAPVLNTFNSQGQLLSSSQEGGASVSLSYTAGLLSQATDALGNHGSVAFDALVESLR